MSETTLDTPVDGQRGILTNNEVDLRTEVKLKVGVTHKVNHFDSFDDSHGRNTLARSASVSRLHGTGSKEGTYTNYFVLLHIISPFLNALHECFFVLAFKLTLLFLVDDIVNGLRSGRGILDEGPLSFVLGGSRRLVL